MSNLQRLLHLTAWLAGIVLAGVLVSTWPVTVLAQDGPTGTPPPSPTPPVSGPVFLVAGVDVNGEGFPVTVVDVGTGDIRTLATFASRSACLPALSPTADAVLYEVARGGETPSTIYQVNTATGQRTTLLAPPDYRLHCPVIAPQNEAIAWIHPASDEMSSDTLVMTNRQGSDPQELATHPYLHGVRWSPTGSLLIYTATSQAAPYPTLYSLPRQGEVDPYPFWHPAAGLVLDYEFAPGGRGLVVAYQTDQLTGITVLSTECVIGVRSDCLAAPVATFSAEASIDLLNAYSPTSTETVVSVQFPDPTAGFPKADLWIVNLAGEAAPRQVTASPALLKTGAMWSADGREIYFIGSQYDADRDTLRGAIYSVPVSGDQPYQIRFSSDFFSPSHFLWRYDTR